jgi:hypothetical protein
MDFRNATDLEPHALQRLFERHTHPFRHDRLQVRVRYSRGADFSGTCYYTEGRIFINLGRDNTYPYRLGTHIAKSESNATHWWRETYSLIIPDARLLALFVYLHELYHYLVKAAKRNPRRKEAMCDRFATRVLVDHFNCRLVDTRKRAVPRQRWDFQDLHAFVAAAPKVATPPATPSRDIPVKILGGRAATRPRSTPPSGIQLHLFPPAD